MKKLSEELKLLNFIVLFAAGAVNAFGIMVFLAPVHLYDSGISGTSMLMVRLFPSIPMSVFLLILNIPLFVYGAGKQGSQFTVYSIFAVLSYAAFSFIISGLPAVRAAEGSVIAGDDLLLCSIFGGLISGVGSGLTIRFGGAIDGIEVMAVIFAKKLGLTVGNFVMFYNAVLYIAAGAMLRDFRLPLYSIITYCAAIKTVDFIVEGFDKAKSVMIITSKEEEISAELSQAFGHGITLISSKGYFKGNENTVIYIVVNRFQIARLKSIVRKIDRSAFVTISEVSDFMGSSIKLMR